MWGAWGSPNAAGGGGGAAPAGCGGAAGQKRSFGAAFGDNGNSQEIIKNLQRTDPVAKEQWIAYCDQFGEGKRDPNRHDEPFIQTFLTAYNSGQRFQGGEEIGIASITKLLQKRSSSFKTIWAQFCLSHGGGRNDPAKHEASFHVQFYDLLAQKALFGMMGGVDMKMMASAMGGGAPGMGGLAALGGMGGAKSGNPIDQLVARIKAFQRTGDAQKQAWWTHCDTMLGGVRDPARHDATTLQAFIDTHSVPEAGDASDAPGSGCMAGMMGMGMGMMGSMNPVVVDDPQKQSMVDRIKAFQKGSESQKETWYGFCGTWKDPARHDIASLQEFINTYGIP